jgi:hypothetical protein
VPQWFDVLFFLLEITNYKTFHHDYLQQPENILPPLARFLLEVIAGCVMIALLTASIL